MGISFARFWSAFQWKDIAPGAQTECRAGEELAWREDLTGHLGPFDSSRWSALRVGAGLATLRRSVGAKNASAQRR
jgi:hypothetical protein